MIPASRLDHVAVLVSSARAAASRLAGVGEIQDYEEFPGEGTGEIYVGGAAETARLLLLQPVAPGPYQRAMERRGPGLHHLGLAVDDLRDYVERLGGSGWYLHPKSLKTAERQRTVWLARPGVGFLVEVHERPPPSGVSPLIRRLVLPDSLCSRAMIAALGCPALASSGPGPGRLDTARATVQLADIFD